MTNLAHLPTKQCSKCKEVKLFSAFSTNNASKDKLQAKCRACDSAYQKTRKEVKREWSRGYQTIRRKDPKYRLQMLLNSSKQRALQKNREHTITIEDLQELYPVDNRCPVFGFELEWNSGGFRETSPSIDRIDSSKGYTRDNIQIISWKANRLKSYATVEDLEAVLAFMKQGD